MAQTNRTQKTRKSIEADAVKEYTDNLGRNLLVAAEFKTYNNRLGIAAITIQTTDPHTPITRRMLSEIPLDRLFRADLSIESERLSQMMRGRRGSTAHQGRQHSDEDLLAVAEIYEAAFRARVPVQRAVADALGISVSTAAKRIMASRGRGFILPTHTEKE